MVQKLLSQSPDIQKILAFEGAFERLFSIIQQEGGIEGGHMAHDALSCVDTLLRYNTSNQVYLSVTDLSVFAMLTAQSPCSYYARATSVKHLSLLCCHRYFSSLLHFRHKTPHHRTSRYSSGIHRRNVQMQSPWLASWVSLLVRKAAA